MQQELASSHAFHVISTSGVGGRTGFIFLLSFDLGWDPGQFLDMILANTCLSSFRVKTFGELAQTK